MHGGLGYSTLGGFGYGAPVHSLAYTPGFYGAYGTGLGLGGIGLGYGAIGLGGLEYTAGIPIGK